MAVGTRMQQRRATAADWATSDYILAAGEVGFAIDTNIIKVGNGTSPWTELDILFDGLYLPILGTAANSELLGGVSVNSLVKIADTDALPTNNTYVKRTSDGGVKASDATEATEVTTLQQQTAAIDVGHRMIVARTVTANAVVIQPDKFQTVFVNHASLTAQVTLTVPTNAADAIPIGTWMDYCCIGAGGAKIVPVNGTVTITGQVNIMPGSGTVRLLKTGTDTWFAREISKGSRLPRIKVVCTVAGQSFGGAYAFVNYDTVYAADTYNPDNEWFSIPGTGLSTARRIICNKDGEYSFNVNLGTTASAVMFAQLRRMTADNSTTGSETKGVNSFNAVTSFTLIRRAVAGQSFGVNVGFVSGATGKADAEYSGGGDPNSFIITRLGD